MTDDAGIDDGTPDDPRLGVSEEIDAVLARADTWADLPIELEDEIVAAIAAEARPTTASASAPVELATVRSRRSTVPWWLAAAAAAAIVVTGVVLVTRSGADEGGVEVALAATELAPGARATAVLDARPAGLKIVLDTTDLAGANDGEMYEAWIGDGDIRVSAGTFHLRGGDGPIVLWAGTADPRFHVITVTIEPIDGDASSSGRVVLRGEFELPAD